MRAGSLRAVVPALAWLRWRVLLRSLGSARREAAFGETLARALTALSWIILIGLLVPVAAGAGVGGWLAGRALSLGQVREALVGIQVILIAQLGALAFTPLMRGHAAFGSAARLRLLPVPAGVLHGSTFVASLGDPWILVVLPGLITLPLGFGSIGARAIPGALVAGLVMLLALALMMAVSTAAELGVQLLLRDRRRAELTLLLAIMGVTVAGFLPLVFGDSGSAPQETEAAPSEPGVPTWLELLPSGQVASALESVARGTPRAALLPCATLALMAAAVARLSWALHRRVLGEPESGSSRRRAGLLRLSAPSWLCSPTGAIAIASFQTSLRTIVGRLAIFSPPLIVALLTLAARVLAEEGTSWAGLAMQSDRLLLAGGGIAAMNLLGFSANQFAVDRAGLTLQFLSPVTDLALVRGKALAHAALLAVSLTATSLVAAALGQPASVARSLAALLTLFAAQAAMAPLAVVLSAWFPRAFDATRIASSAGPHVAASTLGTLAILTLLAGGSGTFALARWAGGEAAGLAAACAWGALAATLCWGLMPAAARVLGQRRERLLSRR